MKQFLLPLCLALLGAGRLAAATSAPAIDPNALAELRRMSDTLGRAGSLTCRTRVAMEIPAPNDQSLTLFPEGRMALRRPDKLRVRYAGDAPPFDLFYDGSSVTLFAPHAKVFSTVKAPPTLDAMLPGLHRETGLRLPGLPLLRQDPYSVLVRDLQGAVLVGPSTIDRVPCRHLAFRRPGVNWEIWIESGPRALPRRLVATFTDRPGRPRTIVGFSDWNLHPWLPDALFRFRKPAGTTEIPLATTLKDLSR
jgi:hypothetical protein